MALAAASDAQVLTAALPEFQTKAMFLHHIAEFVGWPAESFASPSSPLIIGVIGADPFGALLDREVKGHAVAGHRVVVERYRNVAEIRPCHVLFISGSESACMHEIAAALRGRPTLTVADWEVSTRPRAMIRFVSQSGRVRLRVNLDRIRAAGLTVSAKLLRCAETINGGEPPRR